VMGRLGDLAA